MFYRKFVIGNSEVHIWRITESESDLLAMTNPDAEFVSILEACKSHSRRKEKLATRCLLCEIFGKHDVKLSHSATGKPYLEEIRKHISISHSNEYVAIAISDMPVGMDIQVKDGKVLKVADRFISTDEVIEPGNALIHTLLHWSAKEAIYKLLDREGLDFLRDVKVLPFVPSKEGFFLANSVNRP